MEGIKYFYFFDRYVYMYTKIYIERCEIFKSKRVEFWAIKNRKN